MAGNPFDEHLSEAILTTVVYADLFDFPLGSEEVWRDLIGIAASLDRTRFAVDRLVASGALTIDGPYIVLPGRVGLAHIRQARSERASRLWPIAHRIGRLIGRIPFVRMVAVTGSLAAENPDAAADLDYLIVTVPGRLWLARAMAVALVRLGRPAGIRVCPNYLLSTRALKLDHQDLFTAHELLQAVPIVGSALYRGMLHQNRWSARWLPNRFHRAIASPVKREVGSPLQQIGEAALAGPLGNRLDAWEARRKRRRLSVVDGTARFTDDTCEGHYDHHRDQVLDKVRTGCRQLGIAPPVDPLLQSLSEISDRGQAPLISCALPAFASAPRGKRL